MSRHRKPECPEHDQDMDQGEEKGGELNVSNLKEKSADSIDSQKPQDQITDGGQITRSKAAKLRTNLPSLYPIQF